MPKLFEPESLHDLRERFASGDLTPLDYVATLEERCVALESDIQAMMPEPDRYTRLRADAEALADRFPDATDRPPLYGVPIGVKDIFRVDGLPTTAGSNLPTKLFDGEESAAVTKLKEAGALILGKTVSTEFAYFGPGPTRNPRDPARTPGGSSSGSAAAVAAGLVPLAFGTQTIGSICRPAAFCGVVGYKPSYDRIPRDGVIPLAPSLDHVGHFTGDVASAELAASLLCDDWSPPGDVGRPVLAIPKGPMLKRASSEALHHLKATSDRLAAAGFEVKVIPAMADFEDIERRHRRLVAAEAAEVHRNWYADYGALYHRQTVALLTQGRDVTDEQRAEAFAGRERLRDELTTLMAEHSVDLWITPPAPGAAPFGLDSTGDPIMNLPWSHCGLPTLSIPAGIGEERMPLGLQVAAGWRQDETLFAWGRMIEEALGDG